MDVTLSAGTSLEITSTITNLSDGTPRNITASTGTFLVFDQPDSLNSAVITGTATIGDAVNGVMNWSLTPASTAGYQNQFHVFYYECRLTEGDGTKSLIESGKLTLS